MIELQSLLRKLFKRVVNNNDKRGYIAILLCVCIPVLLLGVKFVLDTVTKNRVNIEKGGSEVYKKCAKEAALAVSKNWNPGLTLSQQKDAILKVADAVYNANPCYNDSVIGSSIPGLDIKKDYETDSNLTFGGIAVSPKTILSTSKTIDYITATKYTNRLRAINQTGNYSLWNPSFIMWKLIDKGTDSENRASIFDELDETELEKNNFVVKHHDIYTNPKINTSLLTYLYPTNIYYNNSSCSSYIYYNSPSTVSGYNFSYSGQNILSCTTSTFSSGSSTYKRRISANDATVQVSIDNDKIKVQTDNDIGYAVPAECNIDIVLAIPTNGGTNNIDNRDAASDVAGTPVSDSNSSNDSASTNAIKTPLYQVGQACKNFVKDNFYHIKGVNVGLIPYSAKISISPDKISYVNDASTFVTSYFQTYPLTSEKMCGAALYNTRGEKYVDLSTPYVWGTELVGCPIMCRRGSISTLTAYGNNPIAYGDLLSVVSPTAAASKFQRMNLNPCYMGYSNMLSLKCDKMCTTFLPNPYYMIEPTSDLIKIYEMCNALYPIYDLQNVSNFIFIPVTWTNNFFQSWTNNPSASATNDQLSRPSKTTSGRKKALILIVNKPDWFEPGELTYIGFDNDYSEFPTIESDKIGFDIDYSDTSKRFLDGSNYNTNHTSGTYIGTNNNGLIAGPKKILKFSRVSGDEIVYQNRFYEISSGIYRLTFPQKGLLKLAVSNEAIQKSDLGTWTNHGNKLSSISSNWSYYGNTLTYGDNKFIVISYNGYVAYSTDGVTWQSTGTSDIPNSFCSDNYWTGGCTYGNGKFVACCRGTSVKYQYIVYSNDGIKWSSAGWPSIFGTTHYDDDITYGGGKFLTTPDGLAAKISTDGFTWENAGSIPSSVFSGDYNRIAYGADKFIIYNYSSGKVAYSNDGKTWVSAGTPLLSSTTNGSAIYFGAGKFVFVDNTGRVAYSVDGIEWQYVGGTGNCPLYNATSQTNWSGIAYGNGRWVAVNLSGYIATCHDVGILQFKNIEDAKLYEIKGTQTFYVEPSQISNTKDADGNYYVEFTAGALKLISAEITNREYEKVTPTCYLQGSTNTIKSSGTAYIVTNVKEKMTIKAKTDSAEGYITFYNDNDVEDNIGTHSIIGTKSFTFDGGIDPSGSADSVTSTRGVNFGHNLSKYKVRYILNNAAITYVTLINQYLRDYGGQYNRTGRNYKRLILSDGSAPNLGNSIFSPFSIFGIASANTVRISTLNGMANALMKFRDSCLIVGDEDWYISNQSYWGTEYKKTRSSASGLSSDLYWNVYGIGGTANIYSLGTVPRYHQGAVVTANHYQWASSTTNVSYNPFRLSVAESNSGSGYILQAYIKNSTTKSLISSTLDLSGTYDNDVLYNRGIALQKLSSGLNSSIVSGNYICFQDDGELEVTVKPTATSSGTVKYTKADGSGVGTHTVTTSDSYTTLTIDPATHLYEGNADGSFYVVRLDLNNIALDTTHGSNCGVAFSSTPSQIYRFKKIDTNSNLARRGATYSNTTLSYDSSVISGTFSTFYNILRGVHGISSNTTGKSISIVTPRTLWGDITHITDDYGKYSAYMNVIIGSDYTSDYYMPGCIRIFSPILRGSTYKYLTCTEKSGTNSTIGGAADLLATEITYPINHILYRNNYQPSINTTPTAAVAKITAAACQKLKTDFGNNVRVYVIKYRKQNQYKSFPIYGASQINTDHDYSTVDTCASGTGTPYLYDISTETDLKNALNAIAENIKKSDFANFKNAQNVN